MWKQLKPAVLLFAVLSVITGLAYPSVVTGIAKAAFPRQAGGDTSLIGQPFASPKYFWSRPSATSPYPYNAASSSGSNQGPTNPALTDAVAARIKALRDADPENKAAVPVDLVTASASGLDPHISLAAAEYQVNRVAKARGVDPTKVRTLVSKYTAGRDLGFLGEPGVNLLKLNLALDAQQ